MYYNIYRYLLYTLLGLGRLFYFSPCKICQLFRHRDNKSCSLLFRNEKIAIYRVFFFVHVSSERKTDGQFNSRKSAAPQRIFTTKPTYKSFKYFISAYILYTMYILLCMRVARERENVDDYVLKSSNVNLRISPIRLSMLIFWWNLSSFFDFARVIRYVYFVRVQEMCYDARLIDKFMRFFFIYFYSSLYNI